MLEGKRFLPADRDAHLEERAEKTVIRGLAARAVHGRGHNDEVIYPRRAVLNVGDLRATLHASSTHLRVAFLPFFLARTTCALFVAYALYGSRPMVPWRAASCEEK